MKGTLCLAVFGTIAAVRFVPRRHVLGLPIVTAAAQASYAVQQPMPTATIETCQGSMVFRLSGPPALVDHFWRLADAGFYDGTALHAIHKEAVWGGDPRSRFGYGPSGTLVRGDYYYGKVREWGSGDQGCLSGYGQTEAAGRRFCDFSGRVHDTATMGALAATSRVFGSLALCLGGQPGMTLALPRATVGSQFCIYTRAPRASDSGLAASDSRTGALAEADRHPVIGSLVSGAEVLRALSAVPVASYLTEKRGRAIVGSPSYARPRDIPLTRQAVRSIMVRA